MTGSTGQTRPRLIAAAISLMQARGYFGAGLSAILAAADLPKGSLYHHFPSGKAGLAIAAIAFLDDEVQAMIATLVAKGCDAAALLHALACQCGDWLEQTGFERTPLLQAIAGGGAPASVRAAVHKAREGWVRSFAAVCEGDNAAERARFALCALEGGLAAARLSGDLADLLVPVRIAAAALSPKASRADL